MAVRELIVQSQTPRNGAYSKATIVLEVNTEVGSGGYVSSEKKTGVLMERVGTLLASAREQGVKLKTVVFKPEF